jgi:Na+/H+ antiporter NhaD/arsenite permease-like protein
MSWILFVFLAVYAGLALGRFPGFLLDRTGICLLGALGLVASGDVSETAAWDSVDKGTIGLLFGLMIVSAQLEMAGFYAWVTARLAKLRVGPSALLAVLVGAAGFMAALLTNDVIALTMAPVLVDICRQRRLNPVPFMLGLAFSANAGSVATLMGSPQNMLIGEKLNLHFGRFLWEAGVPAVLSLVAVWAILALLYRGRWVLDKVPDETVQSESTALSRVDVAKGLVVAGLLVGFFLFSDMPRDVLALAAAAILLLNRHYRSRELLEHVDWQLLVLFFGLFVVNGALQQTQLPQHLMAHIQAGGLDLKSPAWFFILTAALSDVVSNVPCVMLLLPFATKPVDGAAMALASGLSSNLLIIGSLANIIVVDAAAKRGIKISFAEFTRSGVPVTLVSLAIAALWLWVIRGG